MNSYVFNLVATGLIIIQLVANSARCTGQETSDSAILVENARLSSDIEALKRKLATANGLLNASFVLRNSAGGIAGFSSGQSGEFTLTAASRTDSEEELLKIVRKNRVPVVPDTTDIVRKSVPLETGAKVSDPILISKLNQKWKTQRFIDIPPKNSLSGVFVHGGEGGIQDFGVVLESSDNLIRYVNWDGFTKVLPISDSKYHSTYTGDFQEFVRQSPSIDFVSYAALMIAHKLGNREGERGWIDLAIDVNVKSFGESDKILSQFTEGLAALNRLANALQGVRFVNQFENEAANINELAERLKDELYTRFNRLGVPILERDALRSIIEERKIQYTESGEFALHQYQGLLSATHLAFFEISHPTAFGPYHVEVKLLDLNTGRVIWSDGRDRLSLEYSPEFLSQRSFARFSPNSVVYLDFNRRKIPSHPSTATTVEQRIRYYKRFQDRYVWLVTNQQNDLVCTEMDSNEQMKIPKSLLSSWKKLSFAEDEEMNSKVIHAQLAKMFMVEIGKITKVSEMGDSAEVYFPFGNLPPRGCRIFQVRADKPRPLDEVEIGRPIAVGQNASGTRATVKRSKASIMPLRLVKEDHDLREGQFVGFTQGDILAARVIPVDKLAKAVGKSTQHVRDRISSVLRKHSDSNSPLVAWLGDSRAERVSREIATTLSKHQASQATDRESLIVPVVVGNYVPGARSSRRSRRTPGTMEMAMGAPGFDLEMEMMMKSSGSDSEERLIFLRYDPITDRVSSVFENGMSFPVPW